MATATAIYNTGVNPLRGVRHGGSDKAEAIKGLSHRRLHKAFLRYHDTGNWPLLRDALKRMGRADLIGGGAHHLVPAHQPPGTGKAVAGKVAGARPSSRPVRGTQSFTMKGVPFPGNK